jgi:tetratricopeptide (TPR) repeat protein
LGCRSSSWGRQARPNQKRTANARICCMKKKARNKLSPAPPPDGKCPVLFVSILCGIIVVLHAGASFFPRGRIWGFNQWAYFSPWISLASALFVLLFFVPSLNDLARKSVRSLLSPISRLLDRIDPTNRKKRYLRYFALSILFVVLFWSLKDRTHFLGDGPGLIDRLASGVLLVRWSEPLEIFLHLEAYHLTHRLWNVDSATVYVALSLLAGLAMIFLLLLFSDYWGKERREKAFVFLILLTMGSMELFFGYVENYSFTYVFVFAFIFFCLGYLEGKLSWLLPLGGFVLAAAAHGSALYLLPSLLFVLAIGKKGVKTSGLRKVLCMATGLLVLLLGALIYHQYGWSVPRLFVPLTEDTYAAPGYLLFSLPHLVDFLNEQLLVSPVGLVLCLAPLACLAGRQIWRSRAFQFLLLIAISQLAFSFVIDPGLGAARDWDLLATTCLGYTVLGIFAFLHLFRNKPSFGYLSLILVLSGLYSTVPWVVINSNEQKSVRRFQNLLEIDPKRSYSGHFILIEHFKAKGMERQAAEQTEEYKQAVPELALIANASSLAKSGELEKAEQMFLEAERLAPKLPQVHNNLGKVYLDLGQLAKAEDQLKTAIRLAPFLPDAYVNLADLYSLRAEYDSALADCKKAIRLDPRYAGAYSDAGTIYLIKGDLESAEHQFRKLISLDSTAVLGYLGLGDVYNREAQSEQALGMYRQAVGLDPKLDIARYRLGMTYLSLGSTDKAKEQLEAYLQISPQGAHAQEVTRLLEQLEQRQQAP